MTRATTPDQPQTGRRWSGERLVWMAVAVAVVVLGAIATVDALGTPFNQCDNIAGTCLRGRQRAAILTLQLVLVAATLLSAFAVLRLVQRRPVPRALVVGVLLVTAALSVFELAADPIEHLNNSRTGGLSGG